ncbi:MAG: AAA family ATPase [Hyphomonadaceae bacterium]|nr:AAA family ATPase [Hyphomonadaceae bacterium]
MDNYAVVVDKRTRQGSELSGHATLDAVVQPHASEPFQDAWSALRRRGGLVLSIAIGTFFIATAVILLRPPIYEASSMLMMSPREPEGIASPQTEGFRPADTGYVDSQVEILRSPVLADRLVDVLELDRDGEWNGGASNTPANRARVVNSVMRAVEPRRRGQTYVVEVAVRSRDPAKAAQMSNSLVEIYMAAQSQARIDNAEDTSAWLETRLTSLRQELQDREGALEAYRAQAGLLTVNGVTLTEQQVQEGETSVLAARVDLAASEARWRQAQRLTRAGGSGDTMVGALTSDVMVHLRERQADIDRRLAEQRDRYGEQHPTAIATLAEKADIERQIASEVGRLTASLQNEAEVSRARATTLQSHLAVVRGQLVRNNAQLAELNAHERGVESTRAIYATFEQRYRELANGAAGVGGEAQLISAASAPTQPASRPLGLMLGLAALVAVMAGIFAGWVAELFGTKVQTPEEIERNIGLPILATIPQLEGREFNKLPAPSNHPGGYAVASPRSAFTESMRLLRSRVMGSVLGQQLQSIAIASALPGDGKTTTALCLARVAAMSGRRTLLMDCDLRGRSLNVLLGIEPTRGLLEVLKGTVQWRDVVGRDEGSGAHILPIAGDSFTAEDVFGGEAMKTLLDEIKQEYDLIVMDCPPVLTLAEAREIAVLAEGVVLVAKRGQTPRSALRTALSELRAVGANVLGVALNGIDANASGRTTYSDPLYFSRSQKGTYFS